MEGYGPDVGKNRDQARTLMRSLSYGPDNRLKVKLSTRNIWYRDPAAILIDQLKQVWIDAQLHAVETANWVPKLMRKDFTVAMTPISGARKWSLRAVISTAWRAPSSGWRSVRWCCP